MPVPAKMADLFTIASSNSPAGSEAIGNSLDDYLRAAFAILRSTNAIASASVASASTTNIGAADAEHVQVTGTATISSFGTSVSGLMRECRFTGSLTITASSNIVTPGGTDIAVVAGDVLTFRSMGGGVWRLVASTNVISLIADSALSIAKTSGLSAALASKATSTQGSHADTAYSELGDMGVLSSNLITDWNAIPNAGPVFVASASGSTNGPGGNFYAGLRASYNGGAGGDIVTRVSASASELWFRGSSGSDNASWKQAFTTDGGAINGPTSAPTLRLTATADVSPTSTGHAFQIGADSGANVRMDSNEIMAANNGAAAPLLLQNDGGGVVIGGGKSISKITVSSSAPGTLADGELYLEY